MLAALWPKYREDRTRALSASTFRGKRAELLPDSKLERLSGIPPALVYLGFLGDPNRFTGYQPRIAYWISFWFFRGL